MEAEAVPGDGWPPLPFLGRCRLEAPRLRSAAMRILLLGALVLTGCATASTYAYNFDLDEPGAQNDQRAGQLDAIEDADVRTDVVVDPTIWKSILLEVTNKTNQDLVVMWQDVRIISPDGGQRPIRSCASQNQIKSGARIVAHLMTFSLPAQDPAAQAYNGARYDLIVPMMVLGQPREYRYHLVAHLQKVQ